MKLSEPLLIELQNEAANTKKYLDIVPAKSFDFKPHEKSMSLQRLAGHVAELPGWLHSTINAEELDFTKIDYTPPVITDGISLLRVFEDNLTLGTNALKNASDETLRGNWTLRNGDHIIFTMSRMGVIRNMVYNHMVHHRGQLSVYLRLLNIKIPGLYGPSADEMEQMG